MSQWYGGTFNGTSYQYVHADQHGASILESDPNKILFGNDGGVYLSTDGGDNMSSRNDNYHTSQYYTVAVAPSTMFTDHRVTVSGRDLRNLMSFPKTVTQAEAGKQDVFVGGLQDNGTSFQWIEVMVRLHLQDLVVVMVLQQCFPKIQITNISFKTMYIIMTFVQLI